MEAAAKTATEQNKAGTAAMHAEAAATGDAARAEFMAQVPLPDKATRQTMRAHLAAVDAVEAAANEALKGARHQLKALLDAKQKKAAALQEGQRVHGVQLKQEEDDAKAAALFDTLNQSIWALSCAGDDCRKGLQSTLAAARRAVHACMAASAPSLPASTAEACLRLQRYHEAAAELVASCAYARHITEGFLRGQQLADELLDAAVERVRAVVRESHSSFSCCLDSDCCVTSHTAASR